MPQPPLELLASTRELKIKANPSELHPECACPLPIRHPYGEPFAITELQIVRFSILDEPPSATAPVPIPVPLSLESNLTCESDMVIMPIAEVPLNRLYPVPIPEPYDEPFGVILEFQITRV
jgi:hypothetical protein